MSSRLFDTLSLASNSLGVQRLGLRVTGNNIANVQTPGYSRQRLLLETGDPIRSGLLELGTGVRTADLSRVRDDLVQEQLLAERGPLGREEARGPALASLEALFPIGADSGLSASLDRFFDSWNDLAAEPAARESRRAVLAASQDLARQIRGAALGVGQLRSQADTDLRTGVERLNELSGEVAQLDRQIRALEAQGSSAPDLRDRLDLRLGEMAELVDLRVLHDPDGAVTVLGGDGIVLVQQGQAYAIETSPRADGHLALTWSGGGEPVEITGHLQGGRLGGLIQLRDEDLLNVEQSLDRFAFRFAEAANTLHRAGSGLDGVSGRDLFLPPAAEAGAAFGLAVDPGRSDLDTLAAAADPAALPGDNGAARSMVALRDQLLGDMGTPTGALSDLVYSVGSLVRSHERLLEQSGQRYQAVADLNDSISGVSLDEEMVDLIQLQHAFEASARVVQVVDEMLGTVIGLKQ